MKEILKKLNACDEAIEWVGDRTIYQAVEECHRGDWLLWLASKLNINHRSLTLAKGMCANTVRHLMQDKSSLAAVDAAIAYGKGEIGIEELNAYATASAAYAAAAAAAYAAAYASYTAAAADAYAAAADAYAANADADASYTAAAAADAYADAADAAAAAADAYAANADAYSAAKKQNQKQTADICREIIGKKIITKFKELI